MESAGLSWNKTHLKGAESKSQARTQLCKGMCREKGINTHSGWVWGKQTLNEKPF